MSEEKNVNHASASGNCLNKSEQTNNSQTKPSLPSTTRLPSYLPSRDLTLGGNPVAKTKKVFIPNLNVQRKKKEDEPAVVQKNSKGPKNKHKGKSDRGNKHHKPNFIQSVGIFTEGLADGGGGNSRSRYSGFREPSDRSDPKAALQKPKLNTGRVVDKEEEDKKLQLLMRDDFIEEDNYLDYENCPVVLPIVKEGKLFKQEPEIKIEPGVQVKIEEEEEEKTALVENGKSKPLKKENFPKKTQIDEKHAINVSQSLENKANGYFLIRFPDCLPGEMNTEDGDVREGTGETTVLDNLSEGLLGKLQILKSGAARLRFGDHNLVVELAPRVFYRDDVIVAKIDEERKTGELVNLGAVHTNLVCTPDWESMV